MSGCRLRWLAELEISARGDLAQPPDLRAAGGIASGGRSQVSALPGKRRHLEWVFFLRRRTKAKGDPCLMLVGDFLWSLPRLDTHEGQFSGKQEV